jgi:hypothetical protein
MAFQEATPGLAERYLCSDFGFSLHEKVRRIYGQLCELSIYRLL